MNGFAALDIHPHRRYVVDIGGRRSSRCRLHINFALFLHSLDFTQNLGVTRHYIQRKADLDDRLYRMYDKIEDEETKLVASRAKKKSIEADKMTADNIYKILIYFKDLYATMTPEERRAVMEELISEIQIYDDRQSNGQWLKSILFKFPILSEPIDIGLDNGTHMEAVILLSK